ncbi:MAG TPA: RNA methyltransferase [Thermoanaerobaculia bacterium]|nr:RNA methyltransferase [Thermoanaerobaculia bacterium]
MHTFKNITSRQNPWAQRIREALHEHTAEIVIEGPKAVAGALAAGWQPLALAATDPALLPEDAVAGEHLLFSAKLFDSIGDTKTSQGALGLFARPRHEAAAILARRDAVVIALDAVQDPGNVGTIIRLAAAFDAAGVLLFPGCADAFSPKSIRSSAGAILGVPVANITVEALLDSGLPLFAADADGAAIDPPAAGAVLIFGSEGHGVSPILLEHSKRIAILTSGRVESLNVAASAAILLARSFALRR